MCITKDFASKVAANAVTASGAHDKERAMCEERAQIARDLIPAVWEWMAKERGAKKVKFANIVSAITQTNAMAVANGIANNLNVSQQQDIEVNIHGWSVSLRLSGYFVHSGPNMVNSKNTADYKDVSIRFPYYISGKPVVGTIEQREHLEQLQSDHAKLVTETNALFKEVEETVKKFTTVAKLLDAWPECLPLLPKDAKPEVTTVAIPVADLNEKIGLPK